MTTYILGAGPTGMAVVDGLLDSNLDDFVVLERSSQLGGLAQTMVWDKIGSHDLGPHKIFSLNQDLVNRVENLIPADDWLTHKKISSIYMNGHYLPYPPSPFALSGVFGLPAFFRMVMGYGFARLSSLFSSGSCQTFEDDLIGRMGSPFYLLLFKPIAEKLWGNPKELDVKLSRGRVQTPSLLEIVKRLLKIGQTSKFEALTFRYPKGGLKRIWQGIEAKSGATGQFQLNCSVTSIIIENNRIVEIGIKTESRQSTIKIKEDDFVVSTIPMSYLVELCSDWLPARVVKLSKESIVLNDLFLVFLHVNVDSLLKESWVFIPDPKIIFHRLSEQESFDAGMTPTGSIVCCEIMSGKDRPLGAKSDQELCGEAVQGLRDMGYRDFEILDQRVIRLPQSYPVFRTGYESGLIEIIEYLDQIENFKSIGRQGAFNYIGTLDAMDIGYGFTRWLTNRGTMSWREERERTNHYPVLD